MSELARCERCGEAIEKIIDWPLMNGTGATVRKVVPVACSCKVKERQETKARLELQDKERRLQTLRNMSLMDSRFYSARFENFKKTVENERLYKVGFNYARNFHTMLEKGQGLLLWGDVGTGKSYTAACIANYLIEKEVTVIMTSFVQLIDRMRGYEDSEGKIKALNSADLLIIDDLGTERTTDFALEKTYEIIDSRYRSRKPMILTTNLQMTQMKEVEDIRYARVFDRIFEMCYPLKVAGKSYRKMEAANRYDEMKGILENENGA